MFRGQRFQGPLLCICIKHHVSFIHASRAEVSESRLTELAWDRGKILAAAANVYTLRTFSQAAKSPQR